ncbi:TetR/AcrR family transcriptional regulator [Stigmatella aurantiaca]|uniref:Transcriptional regulator, TetR family n=1 Tax=Stigmatella aurantiaca (strain DW4/3-1) TaxID=378806 RepID=Q091P9_STIAD|nr:TetR/AcrR family transcriptional regulator [Stigmatella aurantiaca]ADO68652.1 Transcriptional regulator, TetR family [Stigmatella aurantiaca DW4/3-1]EAU66455.1 transcriptional regulator, TetR family [Stigmatella aurantiaca DW4/3-1]
MGKRGPAPSFDRGEALRSAMNVFWEFGYEGATISHLKEAMGGLCAPSLYAAFGSKEALFREAVELYRTDSLRFWGDEQPTARGSIETLLRNAAIRYSTPGQPRGCMVDLGTMLSSPSSRSIQHYLRTCRHEATEKIRARLQRGIAEGDLDPRTNVEALTAFYTTVLQGLSTQANDGASRETMMAAVDCALAAWDHLPGSQHSSPPS